MNFFLEQSLAYAQQRSYLDDLYHVYPTINNNIRDIDTEIWNEVEYAYDAKDKEGLILSLLKLDLFPIKDAYVGFLKQDKSSLKRNPKTVNRLAADILKMNKKKLFEKCSEPKESNRQQGPAFQRFLINEDMGIKKMNIADFTSSTEDAILIASDKEMDNFARKNLFYTHNKRPDFLARMNGKYILGEAKFLTSDGGHQTGQFEDAMGVLDSNAGAIKVAILDGILYLPSDKKMYKDITGRHSECNIMSALLLKDFLYTVK